MEWCRRKRVGGAAVAALKAAFGEADPQLVRAGCAKAAELLAAEDADAGALLEEAGPHALTYLDFPCEHARWIRTNNLQERLNTEIRRRTRVVQVFPSPGSLTRLAGAVFERCGVRRTPEATAVHASRLHVSMTRREECPECGRMVARLNRQTGLCPPCTEDLHVAEARAFNDLLESEAAEAEDPAEIARLRREWDMLRQRNARLCKRHGLAGKSGR